MERRFLLYFCLTVLLLAGGVVGLNAWVDPFARHSDEQAGFDRTPAYTLNRRIFKLVQLDKFMRAHGPDAPPVGFIIGDSTGNQIDAGQLSRLTGRPWFNVSYGGGRLAELVALGEHVLGRYHPREMIWTLPFTSMIGDTANDMPRAIEMAESPARHILTYEALHASLLVLRKSWLGLDFTDPQLETGEADIVTYQLERTRTEMAGRPWPVAELARLEAVMARADRDGIASIVLVPPLHPRTLATLPQALPDRWQLYRTLLAGKCVIDLGQPPWRRRWPADHFADSVHLRQSEKPGLAEALAQALKAPCPGPTRTMLVDERR